MKKIKLPEEFRAWLIGFLGFIVMCIIVFLSAICSGCTNNVKAVAQQTEKPVSYKYKYDKLEEITRAYNHLLHRIWVDKPVYVEDVLTETDEFCILDSLLNGEWADTFDFYNEEDSLAYDFNIKAMSPYEPGCVRVIRHTVIDTIPEPTKSRLFEVFGHGD